MSFFDTTPMGRIINRFSKEMYIQFIYSDVVDQTLPITLDQWLDCLIQVIATIVVIIVATPWFALIIIPVYLIYQYAQEYYLRSSREIKRLESISNSPMYK